MVRTGLLISAALTLAACGPSVEERMGDLAVAELKSGLRDPASLQLTDTMVQVGEEWGAICGYFNARNGFGGMAGQKRFVRVFGPQEMRILRASDYSSEESRRAGWEAHQTSFEYQEAAAQKLPLIERPERVRGLFVETDEPTMTLRRTTDRCVLNAVPIELKN